MNNNEIIEREKAGPQKHFVSEGEEEIIVNDVFFEAIGFKIPEIQSTTALQTIEDLLDRDEQRAKDGFPRRIKLGKIVKPGKNKQEVVVVPTTTEPKFYHDDSITDEEETTGGAGEGEEGEVIGEAPMQPEQGEGEGSGAGQGQGGGHDVISNAFDLGKILTEKFQLPNLKSKGKKRSFTKYTYDLTDKNRRFGQILDKNETLRRLIKTNILLGNIDPNEEIDLDNLILNPNDAIYRILSPEKDFETTAVVFFLRDYSGSMQGKPTEVITTQHLFIYSWLMYQYNQNVQTRFILHDQTAKEVPDFYTYHNSNVAGGTNVYPAFELVNKIVETEQLAKENNIYVFYGTDGDDWDSDGKKALEEITKILAYVSRMGITVAKNAWGGASSTTVEKYIERSGFLKSRAELLKMDSFASANADEARIIEGIRKLVEQHSH
jgi:uncharacterized sporulation protein YeaH/YhbH (DUF444 family)